MWNLIDKLGESSKPDKDEQINVKSILVVVVFVVILTIVLIVVSIPVLLN